MQRQERAYGDEQYAMVVEQTLRFPDIFHLMFRMRKGRLCSSDLLA